MFNFVLVLQNPIILFVGKHLNILANFITQKTKKIEVYAYSGINHKECYRVGK
jgi:hypothetical protein